jgi:hypothetical protein
MKFSILSKRFSCASDFSIEWVHAMFVGASSCYQVLIVQCPSGEKLSGRLFSQSMSGTAEDPDTDEEDRGDWLAL